jgi:hypothetical protein
MSSDPYYKPKHWRQLMARRLAIDKGMCFVPGCGQRADTRSLCCAATNPLEILTPPVPSGPSRGSTTFPGFFRISQRSRLSPISAYRRRYEVCFRGSLM